MFEQGEWDSNKTADELSKQLFAKKKTKRKREESLVVSGGKIPKLDCTDDQRKSKKRKRKDETLTKSTDDGVVSKTKQHKNRHIDHSGKLSEDEIPKLARAQLNKSKAHRKMKPDKLQPTGVSKPKSPRNKYKNFAGKKGQSNAEKTKASSDKKKISVKVKSTESKDVQVLATTEVVKIKEKKKRRKSKNVAELSSQNSATSPPAVKETKRKKKRKKKNNPKKNKYRHLVLAKAQELGNSELKQSSEHEGSKLSEKKDKTPGIKANTFDVKKLKEALSSSVKKSKDERKNHDQEDGTKKSVLKIKKDICDKVNVVKADVKSKSEPSLKEKVTKKLNAARFRYLNEQLYTQTGQESYNLFEEDEKAFRVYHDGFQSQVEKWPSNPLDSIIKYVTNRPSSQIVADFGCGDARLAQSVPNTVHSFDLVALNDFVTPCDMAKVPLGEESVDVCVFCLSLMGTNLVEYLKEANRVLKTGGILKIAEVSSRLENLSAFISCLKKLGYHKINQNTSNKMFVLLDFKKVSKPKSTPVELSLKPCVYKRR